METITSGETIMDLVHLDQWLHQIKESIVVVIDFQIHLVVARFLSEVQIIVKQKMIACGDEVVILLRNMDIDMDIDIEVNHLKNEQ